MKKTYIGMYHYVRPIKNSRYENIKGLELALFKEQLHFFVGNKFTFINIQNIIEGNIPEKSVLLTFDDGYIDHYKYVYPLLKEMNISGVFSIPGKILREKKVLDVNKIHYLLASVNTDVLLNALYSELDHYRGVEFDYPSNNDLFEEWAKANAFDTAEVIFIKRVLQVALPERLRSTIVDKLFAKYVSDNESDFVDELYMNYDQIIEMKRNGMEFAYHGYDHDWLNYLTIDLMKEDISKALDVFDGVFDNKWGAAYPYGGYNADLISILKSSGAIYGLTTNRNIYNPDEDSIFEIPRLDTNDFPPKSNNYLNY